MIALLNETILWWHWIVLGFILLIIEMNTGTFVILGVALASIFVGLLDLTIELGFITEILLTSLLSVVFFSAWKKWWQTAPITTIGQSHHTFNTFGTVTTTIEANKRGKVLFDTPVLGDSSWHATSQENISQDTRIEIVDINGQLMVVKPLSNSH